VERGCARFAVRVSGKDRIEVVPDTSVHCGSIHPVLSGKPAFDVTRKLVRLPVALENRGDRSVKAPARLYGWEDSLAISSPPGMIGNEHTSSLDFISPDSAGSDPSGLLAWRYDDRLPTTGTTRVLASGQRSDARWIEISVHPGVEVLRVTFQSLARHSTQPVPAAAPDTIPDGLYGNPDQILEGSPYFSLSDKVLKNVVTIRFRDGTPQAARQEVVDVVGAELIGGQQFPGMEGYYLIRVEDEGTGKQMREVIDQLNAMPQVAAAEPEYLFDSGELSLYLKPREADSWAWDNEWQLDPVNADGNNWALEAISAPMAWGCSTGDPQAKLAVLDVGFLNVPDITSNTVYAPALGRYRFWGFVNNDHGTRVASVIAARGNNHQGITGVMWQAGLHLLDNSVGENGRSYFERKMFGAFFQPRPELKILEYQLKHAVDRDVSIINISSGILNLHKEATTPFSVKYRQMLVRAEAYRSIISKSRNHPLIVIAAGNAPVDAAWSVFPLLGADPSIWQQRDRDIRDQVLVVGGVEALQEESATIWTRNAQIGSALNTANSPFPAHGLVEIYAPASNVATLAERSFGGAADADWTITSTSGTSFSAPLVAGVAGLLKSFDPSLTTADVKRLLIEGSNRGRRFVRGDEGRKPVYLANAYESLKLAAQRPGAPLCGNRMWARDGEVVAQRGAGTETLFRVDGPVWEVNALHGGRDVRIMHPRGYRSFHYTPGPSGGTWAEVADTSSADWPAGTSGATLSFSSRSHDGDLRVRERTSASAGKLSVRLGLVDTRTRAETPLATLDLPRLAPPRTGVCMLQFLDVRPVDLPSEWEPEYESWRRHVKEGLYRLRSDSTCHFFATTTSVARDATTGLGNGAYSPTGETYLYVASYRTHREQVVPRACDSRERLFRTQGTDTDSVEVTVKYTCRDIRHQDEDSGAEVYAVPLPGGQGWKLRPELGEQGATLWGPRISEDGKEWSATRVSYRQDYTEGFTWHPGWREWTSVRTLHSFERSCTTRFRSLETGAVREEVAACESLDDFVPTFAPSLLPGAAGGTSGTPRPAAPPRHPAAPTRRSPVRT
jgi:hypothetical protein